MRLSIAVAVLAATFVWLTTHNLPPVVASHFDASGVANGFMSRQFYSWFMLGFVVGLPLLVALVPSLAIRSKRASFNLPNRDYWLADERREATVAFLCAHMAIFASLLALFLCYVHWLVVRANTQSPPQLSNPLFLRGLLAFATLAAIWLGVLLVRFRKPRA